LDFLAVTAFFFGAAFFDMSFFGVSSRFGFTADTFDAVVLELFVAAVALVAAGLLTFGGAEPDDLAVTGLALAFVLPVVALAVAPFLADFLPLNAAAQPSLYAALGPTRRIVIVFWPCVSEMKLLPRTVSRQSLP
jgi:hypothetical protein